MNQAEKTRIQHNIETFGMDRQQLEALVESNKDRLPMFVAGLLSDIQELMASAPDSQILRKMVRQQCNVAKFALFEDIRL